MVYIRFVNFGPEITRIRRGSSAEAGDPTLPSI